MSKFLLVVFILLSVDLAELSCGYGTEPVVDHDFAGCFWHDGDAGDQYWQCESADGLWKCSAKMKRASCVWSGPLPDGHPLRRAAERLASTNVDTK
jgi:hypothetical protein